MNLVDELVAQGVLTPESAESMKQRALLQAREQAAQESIAAGQAGEAAAAEPGSQATGQSVIRVPYVPEFVKEQIREEVRAELREDVTEDVVAVAREEKWGTPDALPAWMSRLTLSGDARLRYLGVLFDNNNSTVPYIMGINNAGGINPAAAKGDAFLNTTDDRDRGQVRVRVALAAQMSDTLSLTTRIATGNDVNPISRNASLGNYNAPSEIVLDLAYLQWQPQGVFGNSELTLRGGRLPNSFEHTDLVWDSDLNFDGIMANYALPLGDSTAVFLNGGIFSLIPQEENGFNTSALNEKSWLGAQLGMDFALGEQLEVMFAGAYYDFQNVRGKRNAFNQNTRDWTAPEFITKGNTVFDIRNDNDPDTELLALASEFELLNALMEIDYSGFGPVHVVFEADYVKNIGYDTSDVSQRVGYRVGSENEGWGANLKIGWPKTEIAGAWQIFGGYRTLQRDAVMDAFTDSDFHGSGTDGEGWIAGFSLGIARNAWLRARYLTASEIDGAPAGFEVDDPDNPGTLIPAVFAPLDIDVVQVDLNAKF